MESVDFLEKANLIGGTFAKLHKPTPKPSFAKEPPSQRTTTETMDRHNTKRKRRAAHNNSLAKWRVTCFYDSLVLNQSAVLRLNFCAENPPLRQAAKRYTTFYEMYRPKIG